MPFACNIHDDVIGQEIFIGLLELVSYLKATGGGGKIFIVMGVSHCHTAKNSGYATEIMLLDKQVGIYT